MGTDPSLAVWNRNTGGVELVTRFSADSSYCNSGEGWLPMRFVRDPLCVNFGSSVMTGYARMPKSSSAEVFVTVVAAK